MVRATPAEIVSAVVPAAIGDVVGRPGLEDERQVVREPVADVARGDRQDLEGRRGGDEVEFLTRRPSPCLLRDVEHRGGIDVDGVRARDGGDDERERGDDRSANAHSGPPGVVRTFAHGGGARLDPSQVVSLNGPFRL
jgi:hypothetical protein